MTRAVGQASTQPSTRAAAVPLLTVYSKPPSFAARAPLGAAKLTASRRARAAVSRRLVGISDPTLLSRDPGRQAHTCTIPWWEEFLEETT